MNRNKLINKCFLKRVYITFDKYQVVVHVFDYLFMLNNEVSVNVNDHINSPTIHPDPTLHSHPQPTPLHLHPDPVSPPIPRTQLHARRRARHQKSVRACATAFYLMCIVMSMVVLLAVAATPPTVSVSYVAGVMIGLLIDYISLVSIVRGVSWIMSHPCMKLDIIVFLRHMIGYIWVLVFVYLVLWNPIGTTISLITISSSMSYVLCPWDDIAATSGDLSCITAEFNMGLESSCLYPTIPSPVIALNYSSIWDYYIPENYIYPSLYNVSSPGNIRLTWFPHENTTSSVTVQFKTSPLMCGILTHPISFFPFELPPFTAADTTDHDIYFTSTTTTSQVLDFFYYVVRWGAMSFVYCIVVSFHALRRRYCLSQKTRV